MPLNPLNPDFSLATGVDPFTQVYANIRAALLADAVLGNTAATANGLPIGLRPGSGAAPANFPDLTSVGFAQLGLKQSLNQSDTPYLLLLQGTWSLSLANSLAMGFVANFPVIVMTANQNAVPANVFRYRMACVWARTDPFLGLAGLVRTWRPMDGADDILGQDTLKLMQDRWLVRGNIRVEGTLSRAALANA